MRSRGDRNNNPLNIRKGAKWVGLSTQQDDPSFCVFKSSYYGFRAGVKILETYKNRYNLTSVREVISRWAPPSENNTDGYIKIVSTRCGIESNESIWKSREVLKRALLAMAYVENGYTTKAWELDAQKAVERL